MAGCGLARLGPWVGLGVAATGMGVAAYVFIRVQVLASYPFYQGVYGTQDFVGGVTYTQALELFGFLAFVGLFAKAYFESSGGVGIRIARGAAFAALFSGFTIAAVVYVETRLMWGEILPGVRVWQGLPGGGGYPWGTEQVAYNTCIVQPTPSRDCSFLNYNELFWIAFVAAALAYVAITVGPLRRSEPREDPNADGGGEGLFQRPEGLGFIPSISLMYACTSAFDSSSVADSLRGSNLKLYLYFSSWPS